MSTYNQELPPQGGYPAIRYKRHLPKKGPSGLVLFTGLAAITGISFYQVFEGIKERRELKREKIWARLHLLPMLQAEYDRDAYRRQYAAFVREAEIMKDVPGWEVGKSVYNTKRYIAPNIIIA
ncbi:GRIM-19 protein [Basidiobolus meristosporus CBS 931.73]|uniref:NADH dehydrogenase [ubiquinone] 1 alpha subcomplex subunit 13 n=1 Tax=Basidiobolus meristosporus CBS 931.73 TaxID=1314790 RepID=A0A1Y1WVJ7_9FUNG|nr:GRIM-19 protein [Basidiobolus meristosporus CBS 931.73]|eukprot:ORX77579.1 GRIM-19 protein [Basidiobolus meristosporus CBS 931.73]